MAGSLEDEGYVADFVDYTNEVVVVKWNKKTWEFHTGKHLELKKDRSVTSQLIAQALQNPSVVMEGHFPGTPLTRIYYFEVKCYQNYVTYTKVACVIIRKEIRVKTVFQSSAPAGNVVKERAYPGEFKEIWKSKTNIY